MRHWTYRIYWMDGFMETVIGFNIEDALEKAGYGVQAMNVIQYHHAGDEVRYKWDEEGKKWLKLSQV